MKIYTLGYQDLSVELYVRSLVNAGVGLVLDVREHAWSQRPAFIKSNLRDSLYSAGIGYAHIKEVGNPARNRKTARSAKECLVRYKAYLRKNSNCLENLLRALQEAELSGCAACLTCYERKPEECHRSVLITELIKWRPDLKFVHLQPTLQTANHTKKRRPESSLTTTAFLAPSFLPFS